MTISISTRRTMPIWAWVIPAILLTLFGALSFGEWYRVGLIADPQVIQQYPFGGEGPVAELPNYASADTYVRSALWDWVVSAMLVLLFLSAGVLHSRKLVLIAYALLVGEMVVYILP